MRVPLDGSWLIEFNRNTGGIRNLSIDLTTPLLSKNWDIGWSLDANWQLRAMDTHYRDFNSIADENDFTKFAN